MFDELQSTLRGLQKDIEREADPRRIKQKAQAAQRETADELLAEIRTAQRSPKSREHEEQLDELEEATLEANTHLEYIIDDAEEWKGAVDDRYSHTSPGGVESRTAGRMEDAIKDYMDEVAGEAGHRGPWEQWAEHGLSNADRRNLRDHHGITVPTPSRASHPDELESLERADEIAQEYAERNLGRRARCARCDRWV